MDIIVHVAHVFQSMSEGINLQITSKKGLNLIPGTCYNLYSNRKNKIKYKISEQLHLDLRYCKIVALITINSTTFLYIALISIRFKEVRRFYTS